MSSFTFPNHPFSTPIHPAGQIAGHSDSAGSSSSTTPSSSPSFPSASRPGPFRRRYVIRDGDLLLDRPAEPGHSPLETILEQPATESLVNIPPLSSSETLLEEAATQSLENTYALSSSSTPAHITQVELRQTRPVPLRFTNNIRMRLVEQEFEEARRRTEAALAQFANLQVNTRQQMETHSEFKTRVLDQEPDTIILLPTDPEIVVIGTYSLVVAEGDAFSNRRRGSLQALLFSKYDETSGSELQSLGRIDFDFGIYDVQLHPQYPELIGIATSDAQILFFAIHHRAATNRSSPEVTYTKLGEILIEERRESDNQLAIITQFRFIKIPIQKSKITQSTRSTSWKILLAATTQFGNTKLVNTEIPFSNETDKELSSNNSVKGSSMSRSIQHQTIHIHRQAFDLEAWTILPFVYQLSPVSQHLLLLSGGDDGQLLTSHLPFLLSDLSDTDLDLIDVNLLLTLRKEHQAGVVNICDLGLLASGASPDIRNDKNITRRRHELILTGSYDEVIRLFLLTVDHTGQEAEPDPPICSMKLLSELNLGGGVWKIKKIDEYSTPTSSSPFAISPSTNLAGILTQKHYILLIAGHTSGAHIVRLTVAPPTLPETHYNCKFQIEKTFTEGHESLVYAVEARKSEPSTQLRDGELQVIGRWEIISTSFYDKRICNWNWDDEKRKFAKQQG